MGKKCIFHYARRHNAFLILDLRKLFEQGLHKEELRNIFISLLISLKDDAIN